MHEVWVARLGLVPSQVTTVVSRSVRKSQIPFPRQEQMYRVEWWTCPSRPKTMHRIRVEGLGLVPSQVTTVVSRHVQSLWKTCPFHGKFHCGLNGELAKEVQKPYMKFGLRD